MFGRQLSLKPWRLRSRALPLLLGALTFLCLAGAARPGATAAPRPNNDPAAAYTIQDLGTLAGGPSTQNDWVVGESGGFDQLGQNQPKAFIWPGSGAIQPLGLLPGGSFSIATGVNSHGEACGYGNSTNGTFAFIYLPTARNGLHQG